MSVVVAVDIVVVDLLGVGEYEGPAAQTGGGTIRKSPWLATVFGAKEGRLATGATIELAAVERGSWGREMLVDERAVGSCSREGAALVRPRAVRCSRSRQHAATYWGARRGCRLDGEAPEGIPHIYRKKKEKKNKERNGTGSAGMLVDISRIAEVGRG